MEGQLSEVVGCIYEAALDAELWPAALEAACDFVDLRTSNLVWRDVATSSVAVFHSYNFDPAYQAKYFETYAQFDPFYPAAIFMPVGEVLVGSDLVPMDELVETRFYREWVFPQGYLDPLIVNLERSATSASTWVGLRGLSQGVIDAEARRRFTLLVPHVMRAVKIGRTLAFHKGVATTLGQVVDSVTDAVLLLGEDGGIVRANVAASRLLEHGVLLRQRSGRLFAVAPEANARLAAAIQEGGTAAATVSLGIEGDDELVAQILTLQNGPVPLLSDARARIAVFVRRARQAEPSRLEQMAVEFHLTPGEVRVLAAVGCGGSIAEIADRLGIGTSTVKTHLLSLFAKTGTHRQTDLLRLLSGAR